MMKAGFGPTLTGGEARSYSRRAAEIVFTFSSDHDLVQSGDVLDNSGLDYSLIPTPREANGNCGRLALAFDAPGRRSEYLSTLKRAGVRPRAAYLRQGLHFAKMECPAFGTNA
ncbi:MAG: DUF3343 domain-containing protein [Candidatus Adiutrix sp.]|jgi:hypothetical protein|nr:DUF3343 domain-containing protein [Candidatus Adiutrix sp.]